MKTDTTITTRNLEGTAVIYVDHGEMITRKVSVDKVENNWGFMYKINIKENERKEAYLRINRKLEKK